MTWRWRRGRHRPTPGTATAGSTATATPRCPSPAGPRRRARRPWALRASTPGPSRARAPADPNYAIGYATAALRVDPVLSLAQRGLPGAVAQKVYLDGSPVTLPVVALDVRFGSRHSYRFPTVLLGDAGTTYATDRGALRRAGQPPTPTSPPGTSRCTRCCGGPRRSGRVGKKEAARLERRWDDVQALIDPRRNGKLQIALHRFADEVRDQTGARIRAAVAADLLAYAQAVYRRIGGSGGI